MTGTVVMAYPQSQTNVRHVNFKENSRNNGVQQRSYAPQYISQDELMLRQAIEQQQKKQNRKSFWGKVATALGIACSVVMLVLFGRYLIKDVKADKVKEAAEKAGKEIGSKDTNHKQIGDPKHDFVQLVWKDAKKGEKTTAPILSDTTAKPLQDTYKKLSAAKNLSPKAKEWAGVKEGADIMLEYGYSGTGKTYFAEQFADSTDSIYSMVKYSDLGSVYQDGAAAKSANFFREIQRVAEENPDRKIVVCVDECDALLAKITENNGNVDQLRKNRASVLTGLEELSKNKKCGNVSLFMTTNYHPKNGMIDTTALTRFNRQIEVPLGDKVQNKAMLKLYLQKVKGVPDKFFDSPEFNRFVDTVTKEGFSNRELSKIAEEASKEFTPDLVGVADDALASKPFKVAYLEKAKKQLGQAASKKCSTMKAVAKD